jgi:hypothetical protein
MDSPEAGKGPGPGTFRPGPERERGSRTRRLLLTLQGTGTHDHVSYDAPQWESSTGGLRDTPSHGQCLTCCVPAGRSAIETHSHADDRTRLRQSGCRLAGGEVRSCRATVRHRGEDAKSLARRHFGRTTYRWWDVHPRAREGVGALVRGCRRRRAASGEAPQIFRMGGAVGHTAR